MDTVLFDVGSIARCLVHTVTLLQSPVLAAT